MANHGVGDEPEVIKFDVADVVPVVLEAVVSNHFVTIRVGNGAIEVDEELDVVEGTDDEQGDDDGDDCDDGHDLIPFYGRGVVDR